MHFWLKNIYEKLVHYNKSNNYKLMIFNYFWILIFILAFYDFANLSKVELVISCDRYLR